MYIPELQEATRQFYENCSGAPVRDNAGLPSASNDWVKIPLDGPMTIYAYVWDREEKEVVA